MAAPGSAEAAPSTAGAHQPLVDQAVAVALLGSVRATSTGGRGLVRLVQDVLVESRRRAAAEAAVGDRVAAARAAGVSWTVLGPALGMSSEGARTRYSG